MKSPAVSFSSFLVLCLVLILLSAYAYTGPDDELPLALSQPAEEEAEFVYVGVPDHPAQDTFSEVDLSRGWVDPRIFGGRMLDWTPPTKPPMGEPLNIIISGLSDASVLSEEGFREYTKSIGYSEECFGLHYGNIHDANLGDGNGRVGELYLARQQYFPMLGTCWESFAGGHHFRAWHQNGTRAHTRAWFIGASLEEHSRKRHRISHDGYNRGRDWFVERAVAGTNRKGIWWKAEVEWKEGLLRPGRKGVNHGIPQDGRVAILTVHRVGL